MGKDHALGGIPVTETPDACLGLERFVVSNRTLPSPTLDYERERLKLRLRLRLTQAVRVAKHCLSITPRVLSETQSPTHVVLLFINYYNVV